MAMLAVDEPVNLRSDNVAGIAPEILAAIEAANPGTAPSYSADPITARLQDIFAELLMPQTMIEGLLEHGFGLYDHGGGEVRLVTAFNNSEEQIDGFVAAACRCA